MQFNDTTNRDGILQNIEIESGLGLGTITDNAAPDYYKNYFLSKVNEWLHKASQWIREVNDEAVYIDINDTNDNPEQKAAADNDQRYDLDSDVTKVRKVQAHDVSGGKTVTVTIASPAVFSLTAHGLVAGDIVHFTTTGALPTGLSASTDYYVISAGLTANAFEVSTTLGGSAVNTSGTQSGTHTIFIDKLNWYDLDYYYEKDRVADLFGQTAGKPSKWFVQGRELIFDVPVDTDDVDKYRLYTDRQAHEFVIGDTTAVPGFDKQFHPILVYGPTMDWAVGKFPDTYNKCFLKLFGRGPDDEDSLKAMLQTHYRNQLHVPYQVGRKSINYD